DLRQDQRVGNGGREIDELGRQHLIARGIGFRRVEVRIEPGPFGDHVGVGGKGASERGELLGIDVLADRIETLKIVVWQTLNALNDRDGLAEERTLSEVARFESEMFEECGADLWLDEFEGVVGQQGHGGTQDEQPDLPRAKLNREMRSAEIFERGKQVAIEV